MQGLRDGVGRGRSGEEVEEDEEGITALLVTVPLTVAFALALPLAEVFTLVPPQLLGMGRLLLLLLRVDDAVCVELSALLP